MYNTTNHWVEVLHDVVIQHNRIYSAAASYLIRLKDFGLRLSSLNCYLKFKLNVKASKLPFLAMMTG